MAFDDKTRGRLQKLVTACRGLLTDEFCIQVQQTYGLDSNTGDVTPLERLTHLSAAERETADLLRQTLAHYLASEGLADSAAQRVPIIDRIVREQAFTVLNRLAALLMMEARGVLQRPAVGAGQQSPAFELYKMVAGSALGETGQAYQTFLFSLFDEFAQELPALFDRFAPQGRLFPREAALLQVLAELNHHEIQPLWGEDETIGWIYQYFNSKEERKAMRDASQAPRNSRELAVRNQFFTPRYVVEFLVDNTLGRLWFKATGGQTSLRERCQYLLVKPDEQPAAALRLRDPRTLRLLDPACGSMHFGLYAFDLFLTIYREAWDWEQANGAGSLEVSSEHMSHLRPLCQSFVDKKAYLREVPRLVIEHNIYGVDIDPRAAQIASLALWLRAQRAWHDDDVKTKDRPVVGLGHVIAATAPPAERALRDQFSAQLSPLDAELFVKTLQLLKWVPELGLLMQVERELPRLVRGSYIGKGSDLFADEERESWWQAESRLRMALTGFAQAAKSRYQSRLFAEDALQGFRLIDICRAKFDVVVMNPPFGEPSEDCRAYLKEHYPNAADNLAVQFMLRGKDLISSSGFVGSITDCSWAKKYDYKFFRSRVLVEQDLQSFIHLGWDVLDNANVETNVVVRGGGATEEAFYVDLSKMPDKECELRSQARSDSLKNYQNYLRFKNLPNEAFVFEMSINEYLAYEKKRFVSNSYMNVVAGVKSCNSTADFRLWWEIKPGNIGLSKDWWMLHNGSPYCPFHYPAFFAVRSDKGKWTRLMANGGARPGEAYYPLEGVVYGKRTDTMYGYVKAAGEVFSQEGQCSFPKPQTTLWGALALMNSAVYAKHANFVAGQHKYHNYLNSICLAVDKIPKESVLSKEAYSLLSEMDFANENARVFVSPHGRAEFDPRRSGAEREASAQALLCRVKNIRSEMDLYLCEALQVELVVNDQTVDYYGHYFGESFSSRLFGAVWVSYLVGVAFGRWSALQSDHWTVGSANNLHSGGILVEDGVGSNGLEGKIREAADILWGAEREVVEATLCQSLGVLSVGDYLRKPQAFFADHLKRYSKSRRQAPIYWPLATVSGNYTLWVYYPSLCSQTLYTAINDFVEPKLKQVGEDVAALRIKGSARTRDDEKQFEALQALETELLELRDKLQAIAPGYKPSHDDGVQITAAPLWQLFRHKPWQKVLKDTWAKLEKGEYDWAHLAMAYWPDRVRDKCKTDKSLAIAHGLEELYVEPEKAPKTRGRKKAADAE